MSNSKIYILAIVVVAVGLIVLGSFTSRNSTGAMWEDTEVACLPFGHQNLALHIHPTLRIIVDGESEELSGNIGINQGCMAELHTHDSTGTIHVETVDAKRLDIFTLANFFKVWGVPFERDGYESRIIVEGEEVFSPEDVVFSDLQQIDIIYTSIDNVEFEDGIETDEELDDLD